MLSEAVDIFVVASRKYAEVIKRRNRSSSMNYAPASYNKRGSIDFVKCGWSGEWRGGLGFSHFVYCQARRMVVLQVVDMRRLLNAGPSVFSVDHMRLSVSLL